MQLLSCVCVFSLHMISWIDWLPCNRQVDQARLPAHQRQHEYHFVTLYRSSISFRFIYIDWRAERSTDCHGSDRSVLRPLECVTNNIIHRPMVITSILKSGAVHKLSRKTYRPVSCTLECVNKHIIHRPLIVSKLGPCVCPKIPCLYPCHITFRYQSSGTQPTSRRVVKHIATQNIAQTISRSARQAHHYNFSAHCPSLRPLSAQRL